MSDEKAMVYAMGNGDEMKLTMGMVKKYLVTGKSELITEQELVYFMHECKARRLNPFLRQCWLIKYSEREQAQIRLALLQAMPTDVLYENIIIALIDLTKQFANYMVYGVKE